MHHLPHYPIRRASLAVFALALSGCGLEAVGPCTYVVTSANGDVKDSVSTTIGQVSVVLTEITGKVVENELRVVFSKPTSGISPIFLTLQAATLRNLGAAVLSIAFGPVQANDLIRIGMKLPAPVAGELPALRNVLSGSGATVDLFSSGVPIPVSTSLVSAENPKSSKAICPLD
jgi:hypothetical protein